MIRFYFNRLRWQIPYYLKLLYWFLFDNHKYHKHVFWVKRSKILREVQNKEISQNLKGLPEILRAIVTQNQK